MQGLDTFEDDDGGTVFRDVIMLALLGFIAIVLLLLPHLNPPAKAQESVSAPGNVIVEIHWPERLDADIDLWVEAPGDRPVGYSNKGGRIFNLLRDDLGHRSDVSKINYEVAYSRGVPAGSYTVNVHLYQNLGMVYPVPVTVVASVKKSPKAAAQQILSSRVTLNWDGEEITVFRFDLDDKGGLVPG
ncbi:MAG: hypothetical protein ACTSWM_01225, partial [Alphaproteobacteria bacterium]